MDARDFCDGMRADMTAWKAKILDLAVKADRLKDEDRDKAWEQFSELKTLVAELEQKIEDLRTECPADWSPHKKEIEKRKEDMHNKFEEAIDYIGRYI